MKRPRLLRLTLVNRQAGVVELEDDQVQRGRVNGADVTLSPLYAGPVPEFHFRCLAEQFCLDFVAISLPDLASLAVLNLGIVKMGIMPMAVAALRVGAEV